MIKKPVPENTLDPRLPDSDRQSLSLGIGYKANKLVIDAAYMPILFDNSKK